MRAALAILGIALAAWALPAQASHTAGERFFPALMVIDDPGVDDQASVHPMFTNTRHGGDDDIHRETDLNFEVEKTITDELSVGVDDGYSILRRFDDKRLTGWQNVGTTLKYQFIEDDRRELVSSVGVVREWGGTGRESVGAEPHGSTTPTFYFGKGLGDASIAALRPLAITGTLGYQVPDKPNQDPYQLQLGLSVQYSLPYLQKHSEEFALSDFWARLTPVLEVAYARPLTHNGDVQSRRIVAPGLIYTGDTYQLGVEAVIPSTPASSIGLIVQVHFFLSDIFPGSLGKPLFGPGGEPGD